VGWGFRFVLAVVVPLLWLHLLELKTMTASSDTDRMLARYATSKPGDALCQGATNDQEQCWTAVVFSCAIPLQRAESWTSCPHIATDPSCLSEVEQHSSGADQGSDAATRAGQGGGGGS
jgi:hypothetical protein